MDIKGLEFFADFKYENLPKGQNEPKKDFAHFENSGNYGKNV
jgi:hypothetical protein